MGIGIQICGLNGSGKSTIGKALAEEIGFYFIDNENLFFDRTTQNEPYTNPKSREEVEKLLLDEVMKNKNFIFAAVKGDYGEQVTPLYNYIILVEVPKKIRMQRVRERSFQKFRSRMLYGGDLFEQEENFFRFVNDRSEDYVADWVKTLKCPIIRVDGTKTIPYNLGFIIKELNL